MVRGPRPNCCSTKIIAGRGGEPTRPATADEATEPAGLRRDAAGLRRHRLPDHASQPYDNVESGRSRLVFPFDGYHLCLEASANPRPFKDQRWRLELTARCATALSRPAEAMVDSDWVEVPSMNIKWVWSASKSTAKISLFDLDLAAGMHCQLPDALEAGLRIGYRYLRYRTDVYGVKGMYQEEYQGPVVYYDELINTLALKYRVSFRLPYAQARMDLGNTFVATGLWSPWAGANDEDDHVLRNKSGRATAHGHAYGYGIRGQVPVARFRNAGTLLIGGGYEYLGITTGGTQDQRYYGDDPGPLRRPDGYGVP